MNELYITISVFCIALAGATAIAIRERKPKVNLEPSLFPATPVLIICGITALYSAVHLLNLLGVQTGR